MTAGVLARRQLVLLATVTALGSLAIQMVVPALPVVAHALQVPAITVQAAMTVYLVGVAAGQLLSGPLSDRVGRRTVLAGGTFLFGVGSLLCWVAPTIELLLAGRLVQALGASAGLVVGRSMAGDAGEKGTRDIALLQAIVMLSPMLGPVLGSLIAATAGWRAIFALLTMASVPCVVLSLMFVRAGAGGTRDRGGMISAMGQVLGSARFRHHLLLGLCVTGGLYVFLTSSPFLLTRLYGVAPEHLGFSYAIVAAGAALGALAAGRLSGRRGGPAAMRFGAAISAAAGMALVIAVATGIRSPAVLVAPMAAFAFGGGIVTPNAIIAALGDQSQRIGTAVSAYGALQMAGNALASAAIAALAPHSAWPIALALAAFGVSAVLLSRRAG